MKIVERYGAAYRVLAGSGGWSVLYPLRLVMAGIYGLLVRMRAGRAPAKRARPIAGPGGHPVIVSIGNIEAGGGGKTPCALSLAKGIAGRGGLPVVVTRGFGGVAQRRAPCVVAARGAAMRGGAGFATAEELIGAQRGGAGDLGREAAALGDEVLIYRDGGISVVIDPRRERGIDLARRLFSPSHILLDDSFQNLSVRKDVDILLLDAERPFGSGKLLPLGTLREHPRAAARAGIVIFTRAVEKRIPEEALPFVEGKPVHFAVHEPVGLVDRSGRPVPLEQIRGKECALFSGIARPVSFEETVRSLGARPGIAFRFVDHHRFVRRDVERMLDECGPDALFLTTEKDRAKAIDLFPAGIAVLALRVEMRIDRSEELLDLLSISFS